MGEVFLAERADGAFEQRVALKLVKRGMDSEEIVRRFERERQILARLEHPGIARLLDGGTAPDGRPYFVLELVAGEPILAYCRRVKASFEERLRLVIDACEAVDAAHRSLVVHRDLKPSNLLVSAEGQVKLLDFGIAKLLAEAPEEIATQQMRMLLTPAYAAPEQILGEPVTTATDVYALGVILYELLTGRSPHPRGRTPAAVASDAGGETVERPSAVLREADPESGGEGAGIPDRRRFARRAQGDLDTVVLAALHRDPRRRYGSAAELGTDLRRFLEGKPIRARADSALYRGRKFLLRHKLASAALLAAVLSLVLGIGVSARQARIATAQAQRAERVKGLLLSIFREANPESGQGPELTAREILADGARRVETKLALEPEVQAELFDAIAQIDQSLGGRASPERVCHQGRRSPGGIELADADRLERGHRRQVRIFCSTLPEIVRDRIVDCSGALDVYYGLPYQGGFPDWVVTKGNFDDPISGYTGVHQYALDFSAPTGGDVLPARGGIVVALEEGESTNASDPVSSASIGNWVSIRHDDGTYGFYFHLAKNGVLVEVGDRVYRDSHIADAGGNKLVFEIGNKCPPHQCPGVSNYQTVKGLYTFWTGEQVSPGIWVATQEVDCKVPGVGEVIF
jgi:murein DD-endopeptidase MepM/ murein hydrolase activator NlpD